MDKRMGEYAGVWACFHEVLAEDTEVGCWLEKGRPYFSLPFGEFCPYDEDEPTGALPVRDSLAAHWYVILRRAYWRGETGVPDASQIQLHAYERRRTRGRGAILLEPRVRFVEEKPWTPWGSVRSLLGSFLLERRYESGAWRWLRAGRILDRLLARERRVFLRWSLETLFWGYTKESGARDLGAHLAWLSEAFGGIIEDLWSMLNEEFFGGTEAALGRVFGLLSQDPSEDIPAVMLCVLTLHEEAQGAQDWAKVYWGGEQWVDWAAASDIAVWVPARARVLGEACLPALSRCEGFPSENVRQLRVQALGEIGTPAVLGPLLEALRDPSDWVRLNAIEALARLGVLAAEAKEALRRALAVEEGPLRDHLYALLQSLDASSFASFRTRLEDILFC